MMDAGQSGEGETRISRSKVPSDDRRGAPPLYAAPQCDTTSRRTRVLPAATVCGLGTSLPPFSFEQTRLGEMYQEAFTGAPQSALRLIRRVFRNESGIQRRCFTVPDPRTLVEESPREAQERFAVQAPALAGSAVAVALADAALPPSRVDAIVTCTCTGYLCPGLSSYVVEQLGLRETTRCYDLGGMGCGAALPALDLARHLTSAGLTVVVVAVEVCTATACFDHRPDLIISNAIFADGAAAAVLRPPGRDGAVTVLDFEATVLPEFRDRLRLVNEHGRLKNRLDKTVPDLATAAGMRTVDRLLGRHGLDRSSVRHWLVHPGGTRVLDGLARAFGLEREALAFSYDVLRDHGNMSSPTILFVLKRFLDSSPPDGTGVLLAFGAGFSCYALLFELRRA